LKNSGNQGWSREGGCKRGPLGRIGKKVSDKDGLEYVWGKDADSQEEKRGRYDEGWRETGTNEKFGRGSCQREEGGLPSTGGRGVKPLSIVEGGGGTKAL